MNVTARETPAPRAAPATPADMPALDGSRVIRACERGFVPDALMRLGMRALMRRRLIDEHADDPAQRTQAFQRFLDELRASPIAIDTQAANAQHYELPDAFFEAHLGPRLKYSCGYYPRGDETLAQAELAMLELYAKRARLANGQRVLDLGCGWGSLALWSALRYPRSEVVALSNSHAQRAFIEARARAQGIGNLRVVTGDVVDFEFGRDGPPFDRILSVEMFEHMKNYPLLLAKIARWLADDGLLFVHLFAHQTLAYHFASRDGSDWMARYFFTGGTMPSSSLLLHCQDDMRAVHQWWLNGTHYERTANQWLAALDAARDRVMPMLQTAYGDAAATWFRRWRMFYLAVAELFGYAHGTQWGVAHYLFEKRVRREMP
ncbi:cyclopropane-fatty-acyl-phospholipid synthase [Caballeronia fortuita]|uniref:Cyclopropane-fatty-acyl-phospholipid synthase n=1 Tax=Caballeronia fortuita TaxID=1777138 RepID=A0A158E0C8_9BURK|nr:cyclopropane-fatty-acyl-phospholipid synthase family protein [Caballeronia fortuita]SAL00302.1 cyclopropane-fatty-acyl-phospholipid synthase [Caballeronia fortuita]